MNEQCWALSILKTNITAAYGIFLIQIIPLLSFLLSKAIPRFCRKQMIAKNSGYRTAEEENGCTCYRSLNNWVLEMLILGNVYNAPNKYFVKEVFVIQYYTLLMSQVINNEGERCCASFQWLILHRSREPQHNTYSRPLILHNICAVHQFWASVP